MPPPVQALLKAYGTSSATCTVWNQTAVVTALPGAGYKFTMYSELETVTKDAAEVVDGSELAEAAGSKVDSLCIRVIQAKESVGIDKPTHRLSFYKKQSG